MIGTTPDLAGTPGRLLRLVLWLLLAAAVHPSRLIAQALRPVTVGAIVRVFATPADGTHPAAWREGRLLVVDSTMLTLGEWGLGRARHAIPRADVWQIEVRERPSNRTGRTMGYAALGGVAGAVVGGLIGSALTQCTACEDPGMGAVIGFPLGGILGAVAGGVARNRTAWHWVPAALPGRGTR